MSERCVREITLHQRGCLSPAPPYRPHPSPVLTHLKLHHSQSAPVPSVSFDLCNNCIRLSESPSFSGEEPKAQRGEVSSPRSHGWQVMESGPAPRAFPRALGLSSSSPLSSSLRRHSGAPTAGSGALC